MDALLLTFVIAFFLFLYIAYAYYKRNDGRGRAPLKTMIVLGSGGDGLGVVTNRRSHE